VLENPTSRESSARKKWTCAASPRYFTIVAWTFSHVFEHLLVKDLDKTHEDI
jgi:hypothetical protein